MQLREDNKKTQSHYYAKASARNVLSHIRQWLCFSIFFGLCYFPARVEDVIPFLELMALSSGYEHIKAVLGSISFLHKNLGLSFPADSFQIKLTLQALKRRLARAPNQALPITPAHLLKMYNYIDISNPQDLALWCAFLVGFFGLLRKKSICPEDSSDIDPVKILTVRKVSIDRGKGVALLYVNFSKTIQFGQRDLIIPLVSNNCRALDPVFHLDLLLSKTKAPLDSPAFSYRTRSGSVSFITHKIFTARLKNLLSRGAATFLYRCGSSQLEIQACGDWQSQIFTRYLHVDLAMRLQSQNLMATNLLHQ